MELDVKPKSKRKKSDDGDGYVGGASSSATKRPSKASGAIDPNTEALARMVGINMDDPEVQKRFKNNHGRKSYTRYE
jgi:hypothetical protein